MRFVCFRYPRNRVTDILICLLCIFLIILIFQFDSAVVVCDSDADGTALDFLENNGWVVDEKSVSFSQTEFSFSSESVMDEYIELQKAQGFLIEPYIGKTVKKISYEVLNLSGYLNEPGIYANVYIYDDKIIAAEICSVRIDGFLQGAVADENKIG